MNVKNTILVYLVLIPFLLFPCSGVNKTVDGKTLFGGNYDWMNPYTEVMFVPANKKNNGYINIGYGKNSDDIGWGPSVNDKGLAVIVLGTPYKELEENKTKEIFYDHIYREILQKCSSVDDALDIINKYNRGYLYATQMMLVDKLGNSTVVEINKIIEKNKNYQIATNFNQSDYDDGNYPCIRYTKAQELIDEVDFTVEGFETILFSMKQPKGFEYPTLFSYIFDLNKGEINLYNFGDFSNKVVFNIDEELKKGYRSVSIASLTNNKEYENYLAKYINKKPKRKKMKANIYDYSGSYQFEWGAIIEVYIDNNKLYTGDSDRRYELIPFRKDSFFYEKLDWYLMFKRNKSGEINEVVSYHNVFGKGIAEKIN